jgi:hypothetical protein
MATSSLEKCVINALKLLGDVALQMLRTALQGLLVMLQEELLVLAAQALPLQAAKTFLQGQAAVVRQTRDLITNVSNLLPVDKLSGPCISLSLMNLQIADRLAPVTDALDSIEMDILTLASLVDLNTIAQKSINELMDTTDAMIDAINQILDDRAKQMVLP